MFLDRGCSLEHYAPCGLRDANDTISEPVLPHNRVVSFTARTPNATAQSRVTLYRRGQST